MIRTLDDLTACSKRVVIAHFLHIRSDVKMAPLMQSMNQTIQTFGGQRCQWQHLDQFMAGGVMKFSHVLLTQFPSGEQAAQCLRQSLFVRKEMLDNEQILIVDPQKLSPTRGMSWLRPLLYKRLIRRRNLHDLQTLSMNAQTGPTYERLEEVLAHPSRKPCVMLSLNAYYPVAQDQGMSSGQTTHQRFIRAIRPYWIAVGARPLFRGQIIGRISSGYDNPGLMDQFDDLTLVRYPDRMHFLQLVLNVPMDRVHDRKISLRKAVMMLTSDPQGTMKES